MNPAPERPAPCVRPPPPPRKPCGLPFALRRTPAPVPGPQRIDSILDAINRQPGGLLAEIARLDRAGRLR